MLSVTKARTFPRPGRPGRSRHDGRRPDLRPRHSARKGAAGVSVARVNARERYVERRGTGRSFPPVLESGEAVPAMTTRDVRDWRCARSRLLQPTRRGRSIARGAVMRRSSEKPKARTSRSMREQRRDRASRARTNRSWPVRIARPFCPCRPNRANGIGPGRTLTPYVKDGWLASYAHDGCEPHGPHVRS